MKKLFIILFALTSLSVLHANTELTCEEAIRANDEALELFGANTATAYTGWQAYHSCKELLDEEGKALATLLEGRCLRAYADEDGSMYRSFAAQCAYSAVEFLMKQIDY